jgi:hypothetical protein
MASIVIRTTNETPGLATHAEASASPQTQTVNTMPGLTKNASRKIKGFLDLAKFFASAASNSKRLGVVKWVKN